MEIDSLEIVIESSSEAAIKRVNELTEKLRQLKETFSSMPKNPFGGMGGSGSAERQKQDYSELSAEAENLGSTLGKMPAHLQKYANALAKVRATQAALSGTRPAPAVDELRVALNQANAALEKSTSRFFGAKSAIQTYASAMAIVPPNVQRVVSATAKLETVNTRAAKSYGVLGTGISSATVKLGVLYVGIKRAFGIMGGWVKESNDYVENLNLFTVAMGDYAKSAKAYAEEVQLVMGIDPSEWMRNQGVFMQMATGFGVVQDKAALLSKNLTQLGYDISSFYNISIEDAMQKLQSGVAGEIEPLRRLGYAIDVASLQQVAYNHGIEQSVNTMTQAQKAQLRYVAIMEQSGNAMGDLARTIQTPANAMRILQQQITQLARAAGNVLIPALQAIIPVVQAVVEVITDAVQRIANLFGFQLPTIDYSGMDGLASSGGEAEDALSGAADAAKELKNATLGIDELNVISPATSVGGVGTSTGFGGDLPLQLPEYDFLGDLQGEVDTLKEKLKPLLFTVGTIGALFAAWKIGNGLIKGLSYIIGNLKSIGGTILFVAGLGLFLYNAFDAFVNGLDWENLTLMIAGVGGAVLGLALAGQPALAALAAIAGGVVITVLSVMNAAKNRLNDTNLSGIIAGITIATIGLTAAFGSVGTIIGAVVGGIVLLVVGFNDFIDNGATEHNILAISAAFAMIGLVVGTKVNAKLGAVIIITGLVVAAFLTGADKMFGALNVVWEAIKNGIKWLGNLLSASAAVFSNIFHAVLNFREAVYGAVNALMHNVVIFFQNGIVDIKSAWYGLQETILTAVSNIANKVNSLTSVFGVSIDTSGISSQIDELAAKEAELQNTKKDYVDIGAAWKEGLSTFDYKSVSDAFNTFETFEDGWAESAYTAGADFGNNLRDGLQESLGGLRETLSEKMGEITGMFSFGGEETPLNVDEMSKTVESATNIESLTSKLSEYENKISNISDSVDVEGMQEKFDTISESYKGTTDTMMLDNATLSTDTLAKIDTDAKAYSTALESAKASTQSATDGITRMFRTMASNSMSAINGIISSLNSIPRNITTVHTIITVHESSGGSSIDAFASGGYPDHGQLFLAREAGPELVGTIGGQTAVANNTQIVEGITRGVSDANQTQNALLREQNELLMAILQKTGTISISGKTIKAAYDKESSQRGANIMRGGVMAY